MKTKTLILTSLLLATLFTACSSYEDHHEYDYKKYAKWLSADNIEAKNIPTLFGWNKIDYDYIMCVNWENYQYKPHTVYAIAYTDSAILLHFKAKEQHLRAFKSRDMDSVWTDGCVAFFFEPNKDGNYYALFSNCTGHLYMDYGKDTGYRDTSSVENLVQIKRWASLGTQAYPVEFQDEQEWEVALLIPYNAFWRHEITGISGLKAKANLYKCGGAGDFEHYVTWNPVLTPEPNFFQSQYFKEISFIEH